MKAIPKELMTLLRYRDGHLFWTSNIGRKMREGARAGTTTGRYTIITFCGNKYQANRIVWRMFHGSIPEALFVVPLNHNGHDLRIENLTLRTRAQLRASEKRALPIGVSQNRTKFSARRNGKYLGYFASAEEASDAYTAGDL